MNDPLLKIKDVYTKLGISRSHFNTLRQKGMFPVPILVSKKNKRWPLSVVDEWLSGQVKEGIL